MGKLMKNGRIYGGHSTTAATVTYTDTHSIGATNTQDALDKVAQRVINQSAASGVSYTDTNKIGATNVQSAVDFFGAYSDGQATINTAYLSGTLYWQKIGKLVSVYCDFQTVANMPGTGWEVWLFNNLPPIRVFTYSVRRFTVPSVDPTKPPLTLAATNSGGPYNNKTLYSWGNGGINSGVGYRGNFEYFTF